AAAGLVEKSVAYWGRAGRRSADRSAMAEAAAQFRKGLDQLRLVPDNPERQRQELEFCSALGAVLRGLKGTAAPETGHAFTRARELWEQLGFPPEFLYVGYLQSRYHVFRGELDSALRQDEELLRLSRRQNDPVGLILSHTTAGLNLMSAGKFASSRSHLEEAVALCNPAFHRALIHQVGVHPYGSALPWLGIVLFCLGFPDQALARARTAAVEARRLAHPPTLASGLTGIARLMALVGDQAALDEYATQILAVAAEQDFPLWQALGTFLRGWVRVENGETAEGTALMRGGWAARRATGTEGNMVAFIALLARASDAAGQFDEAVTWVNEALRVAERTGELWLAAELYRHKGQLLLRQGQSDAAEELYRKALSVAEEQEARLWELRAAMSLARLRRDQGRRGEARNLLGPIYNWFTEGFGVSDLKDAKSLLDELA
ncbi:MAG TPA: tetratricopeptide repeat protein, partial [Herpetosiphonaceae bacterium]|nr:tetratricopeptide repeat protein [Herpetosiphonaceae bacterium]